MATLISDLSRAAAERGWAVEAKVRAVAGGLIILSLGLSLLDRRWLLLTAFVGANLLQSGLSGWCLLSNLLSLQRRKPKQL